MGLGGRGEHEGQIKTGLDEPYVTRWKGCALIYIILLSRHHIEAGGVRAPDRVTPLTDVSTAGVVFFFHLVNDFIENSRLEGAPVAVFFFERMARLVMVVVAGLAHLDLGVFSVLLEAGPVTGYCCCVTALRAEASHDDFFLIKFFSIPS